MKADKLETTMSTQISNRTRSEAYRIGYSARMRGWSRLLNPYQVGSKASINWLAGWWAADRGQ